jgi:cell division septation protein DedD
MASIPSLMRRLVPVVFAFVAVSSMASAQSFDERARTILQLFETGQKDSAYMLIEPLKKEARFVPSVIYTRAQMTPDDRALSLYREIIALEPGGGWADDAAYQLVRRYIDKRDSAAAHTWANVLRTNYPRSPFVAMSDESLRGVTTWLLLEDPDGPVLSDRDGRTKVTRKEEPKPAETYKASRSNMRGYALQVGLFPTRAAAEKRATELSKKKLKAVALPKTVEGKKQYALVVGPYKTIDEAGRKKSTVSTGCNCQAFVVKVE